MQSETLTSLNELLARMEQSPTNRAELERLFRQAEKDYARIDFKYQRTLKDRDIAMNLLRASVENLEINNIELTRKNLEIEEKNAVLEQQKRLLEENARLLEKQFHDLETSFQELEQFSYIASHDLKSPLRNIASYAQLLQRRYGQGQLDEQADEFIRFIVNGAKHMNEVICDLLEYSRVGIENRPDPVRLQSVFETVEENLQEEIQVSGATFFLENELPEIAASKTAMVQLFQHLLGNALKFCSPGQPPVIRIHSIKEPSNWHFSVQDNGIGIDMAFQKKVFQPFQRLEIDRPGMGMGLAICRKIVRMHGGDIWFFSKPGLGTTFHFTLATA